MRQVLSRTQLPCASAPLLLCPLPGNAQNDPRLKTSQCFVNQLWLRFGLGSQSLALSEQQQEANPQNHSPFPLTEETHTEGHTSKNLASLPREPRPEDKIPQRKRKIHMGFYLCIQKCLSKKFEEEPSSPSEFNPPSPLGIYQFNVHHPFCHYSRKGKRNQSTNHSPNQTKNQKCLQIEAMQRLRMCRTLTNGEYGCDGKSQATHFSLKGFD